MTSGENGRRRSHGLAGAPHTAGEFVFKPCYNQPDDFTLFVLAHLPCAHLSADWPLRVKRELTSDYNSRWHVSILRRLFCLLLVFFCPPLVNHFLFLFLFCFLNQMSINPCLHGIRITELMASATKAVEG